MPYENIQQILRDNPLFEGFTESQLELVIGLGRERSFDTDETIIQENEIKDEIYIVLEGELEVYNWDQEYLQRLHIASVGPNQIIGELTVLDNIPRSASVRATKPSILFEFSVNSLKYLPEKKGFFDKWFKKFKKEETDVEKKVESPLYALMTRNLAKSLSQRLRSTNVTVIESLRKELEHTKARIVMGSFIITIICILILYLIVLTIVEENKNPVGSPTFYTMPIIAVFAIIVFIYMKKTHYPLSVFGLTLKNWRESTKDALIFTFIFMIGMLPFKWILIHTISGFSNHSLIEGDVIDFALPLQEKIGFLILYLIFVPLQEFIVRGALQSSFEEFLVTPYKRIWAIVLSNILFATTHFHVSITLAILTLIPGFLWGWLYSRHRTLVGVIISHELIGIWGLFILGF